MFRGSRIKDRSPKNHTHRALWALVGASAIACTGCAHTAGSGFVSQGCVSYQAKTDLAEGQKLKVGVDDISATPGGLADYLELANDRGNLSINADQESGDIKIETKGVYVSGGNTSVLPGKTPVIYIEGDQHITISSDKGKDKGSLEVSIEQTCKNQ